MKTSELVEGKEYWVKFKYERTDNHTFVNRFVFNEKRASSEVFNDLDLENMEIVEALPEVKGERFELWVDNKSLADIRNRYSITKLSYNYSGCDTDCHNKNATYVGYT